MGISCPESALALNERIAVMSSNPIRYLWSRFSEKNSGRGSQDTDMNPDDEFL
jgi:hypothetical protein